MNKTKSPEDIRAEDIIARAKAKGYVPPHEYPPEVIIKSLRESIECQDKVITCQDEMLETLRERINGLGTVIQSQIDEIVTMKRAVSVNTETIVRVLSHQGHINTADDDIQPHLREIQQRYSELKATHDFMTSAQIARVEWLERFMKKTHTP